MKRFGLIVAFLFSFIFTTVVSPREARAVVSGGQLVRLLLAQSGGASTANVSSTGFVELVHSTVRGIAGLSIFNATQKDLELAFGPSGSEVVQLVAPASTANGPLPPLVVPLEAGYATRISVISLDSTASTGQIQLNLFYN